MCNYTAVVLRDYPSTVYIDSCEIQESVSICDGRGPLTLSTADSLSSLDLPDYQRRVWEECKDM